MEISKTQHTEACLSDDNLALCGYIKHMLDSANAQILQEIGKNRALLNQFQEQIGHRQNSLTGAEDEVVCLDSMTRASTPDEPKSDSDSKSQNGSQDMPKPTRRRHSIGSLTGALHYSVMRKSTSSRRRAATHGRGDGQQLTWRMKLLDFVNSTFFESFFALTIITNSLFVGVQIEYEAHSRWQSPTKIFMVIEQVYATLFIVELVLRLGVDPRGFLLGQPGDRFSAIKYVWWNYMDILIVCSSSLEAILALEDSTASGQLRQVRILRLARMLRLMKAVRFVGGLRRLIESILHTLKALMWSVVLMFLIIYAFGMMFTDAVTGYALENQSEKSASAALQYFGSLYLSMSTLFQSISGGIDWGDAAWKLHDIGGMWIAFFYLYIAFCMFCVLNIMAGDFCQNAIENAARDREAIKQRISNEDSRVADLCLELYEIMDDDEDGYITCDEFLRHSADQHVKSILQALDLPSRDPEALFGHFDITDGHVSFKNFVNGCKNLRGPARALQVAETTKETLAMKHDVAKLTAQMQDLEEVVGGKEGSTGLKRRSKARGKCQHANTSAVVPDENSEICYARALLELSEDQTRWMKGTSLTL